MRVSKKIYFFAILFFSEVSASTLIADASSFDCFFPQVCSDDGSGCTLTSTLYSISDGTAIAQGDYPSGATFAVEQKGKSLITLIVLPSGQAKLTRIDLENGKGIGRLFHGVCKVID